MSLINVDTMADSQGGVLAPISSVMRNRLINSDMRIDQRNAGASVSNIVATIYTLDRWTIFGSQASKFTCQQNAGSVIPPTGFTNYLGITSSSAYAVGSSETFLIRQYIEGFNISDLGWGTANAKTVTLSFQVYSSLTGTFGGSLMNNGFNRSYPFTYSVPVANTWTTISVTIAGDTSGTWVTDNGLGIRVAFSLGTGSASSGTAGSWSGSTFFSATGATSVVGTNGATFYITGVQLEKGTQATSFEYRQYQQELALCQRYFEKSHDITTAPVNGALSPFILSTNTADALYANGIPFKASKRTAPTMAYFTNNAGGTGWGWYTSAWNNGTSTQSSNITTEGFSANITASGLTSQNAYLISGGWTASSEL